MADRLEELPFRFARLEAHEAARLVECVRKCYGDSYAIPWFYDAKALARKLKSGRLVSCAAFAPSGRVVAHMGLVLRRAGDNTGDAGTTLVDPDYRGRGLMKGVGIQLAHACKDLGLVAFHDYPITVHAATQRLGLGVPTGLMLDHLPADVSFSEMQDLEESVRTASLIRYHPLGPAPAREVFLPERIAPQVREIYEAAGLERSQGEGLAALPSAGRESRVEEVRDSERGLVRLAVEFSGGDLARVIRRALEARAPVVQVDLSLARRETPSALLALYELGFYYAGVLPEYADGDVLRLQRLENPSRVPSVPVLEGDAACRLRDFVFAERAAVLR